MSMIPPDVRVACVQRSPLFNGLMLVDCGEIVSLAQERCFAKYQAIYRQGDPVKFIFVLVSGRLKTTETSHGGAEVILSIEEAGSVVGELRVERSTTSAPSASTSFPNQCVIAFRRSSRRATDYP